MATKDNSQKRVVPKTKDELIKMLSERLELAEVTQLQTQTSITEMQNTLEEEREKRETLSTELKEKEDKIAELIETESKTLQDKVQETLYNTLESANKMRTEAGEKLKLLDKENQGLDDEIINLDNNLRDGRLELNERNRKLLQLQARKNDLKLKEQNLLKREEQLQGDKQKINRELEHVEKDHKELSDLLQNMKKLRMYLNATLDGQHHANRKIDSQKENRHRAKAASQNDDNFWNVDA